MAKLDKRILEELIYERVRLAVDLCELLDFESDLSVSTERALKKCARSPEERSRLTLDYLRRAWQRVADEVLGELTANPVLGDPATRAREVPPDDRAG